MQKNKKLNYKYLPCPKYIVYCGFKAIYLKPSPSSSWTTEVPVVKHLIGFATKHVLQSAAGTREAESDESQRDRPLTNGGTWIANMLFNLGCKPNHAGSFNLIALRIAKTPLSFLAILGAIMSNESGNRYRWNILLLFY